MIRGEYFEYRIIIVHFHKLLYCIVGVGWIFGTCCLKNVETK